MTTLVIVLSIALLVAALSITLLAVTRRRGPSRKRVKALHDQMQWILKAGEYLCKQHSLFMENIRPCKIEVEKVGGKLLVIVLPLRYPLRIAGPFPSEFDYNGLKVQVVVRQPERKKHESVDGSTAAKVVG